MLHFSLSGVRSLTNPLRGTFQAHKICYKVKLNEEISNIKSFFGSLGYPLEVIKKKRLQQNSSAQQNTAELNVQVI